MKKVHDVSIVFKYSALYIYILFSIITTLGVVINSVNCAKCYIAVVCCTCDMVAKATLMNMQQFNGFYGCPVCLQPGTL